MQRETGREMTARATAAAAATVIIHCILHTRMKRIDWRTCRIHCCHIIVYANVTPVTLETITHIDRCYPIFSLLSLSLSLTCASLISIWFYLLVMVVLRPLQLSRLHSELFQLIRMKASWTLHIHNRNWFESFVNSVAAFPLAHIYKRHLTLVLVSFFFIFKKCYG